MRFKRKQLSHHEPEPLDIRIPDDVHLGEILGCGARAIGYEGNFNGRKVVIKFYRPNFIKKFRNRYGVDIAQFEYDRNAAFRAVPGLKKYTVEPIRVLDERDGHSAAFIQEFVEGKPLLDVIRELGHLPARILEMGREIVDTANAVGLHDLDISDGNIMVRKENDDWRLIIYDFNLMPQYLHAPNPIVKLWYILGIRKKSGRDYKCLERWAYLGEHGGYDPK